MKQTPSAAEWDEVLGKSSRGDSFTPLEQNVSDNTNLIGPISQTGIIEITGDDAITFLHALVTGDIAKLGVGDTMLTAWYSPKGRVVALFRVLRFSSRLLLLAPEDQIKGLLKKLKLYILRAQVELREVTQGHAIFKIISVDPPDMSHSLELCSDGNEHWICDSIDIVRMKFQKTKYRIVSSQVILLYDLEKNVPKISSVLSEKFLPQELGLEDFQGLSFDKGCYPGQEIIARVRYRGKVKKIPALVEYESSSVPPEGSPVNLSATGKAVGTVLYGISGFPKRGKCKLLTVLDKNSLCDKTELKIGLSIARIID